MQAGADAYAKRIGQLITDQKDLKNLKSSSRKYYDEVLNWDLWGRQFQQIAERLVKEKR
jgi:hypothetical protein